MIEVIDDKFVPRKNTYVVFRTIRDGNGGYKDMEYSAVLKKDLPELATISAVDINSQVAWYVDINLEALISMGKWAEMLKANGVGE